jgi:cholesterol transport system auxiliary component
MRLATGCRALPFAVLAGLLCGCVSALEFARADPPRLFDLTPKSTFDADLPEVEGRLDVEIPTAATGLNTARIALKPTSTRLEYYARARWVDVVPVMVQTLLQESFDNSGKVDVIGRGNFSLRADYALLTTIREFQAEYRDQTSPPTVRVRLQTRLVRLPRRTAMAETSAEALVPASDRSMQSIVAAFDDAFGRTTKQAVQWTIQRIAEAEASGS